MKHVSTTPRQAEREHETHLEDELLVNVSLRNVGVEVGALDEAQEEFVDDLEMRPGELEDRLVLLGVVRVACGVDGGRDGTEEVGGELQCTSQYVVVTR